MIYGAIAVLGGAFFVFLATRVLMSRAGEGVPAEDAQAYEFASIIAPMIDEDLVAIRHFNGVYELAFSSGRSAFAGKFRGENAADNVLIVTALDHDAPFTWGLLD